MNKEEIYDEKIAQLMAEIIAICQQHKIAMLASFTISTEDDPTLQSRKTFSWQPSRYVRETSPNA